MALKIYWSKKAADRFEEITSYLLEEWGEKSTGIFIKKVFHLMEILGYFPEIGSIENKKLNIRGFIVVKQITLFYKITDKKIILLNFYDNRQKPKRKKHL